LQDDLHAYLPRIGASLFMSPGGDKFVQFLFCFSRYVLDRVTREHGLCTELSTCVFVFYIVYNFMCSSCNPAG